jgi:UDP-N-acetylmuramoylalanine--D-glutamate ligase
MELFQPARAGLPPHKLVGVTGTNGKSTATALIHHLLAAAGYPARLGGNIGLPILDQPPLPSGGVYVLELSSYQIDLCQTLACDVACWTNLAPDHLDRHGTMEGYFAAKARLFGMQQPGATAIIATDDSWTRRAFAALPVSLDRIAVSAADVLPAMQARWPALAGPHNAQNAAIAIAAARALGAGENAIETGLESFPGLPHRMELVGSVAGVRYVNDSKATNPASVAPALQAFPNTHWILGGQAKGADLDACLPHLGHVLAAYTIGEAGPLFARLLQPHLTVIEAGTLERAVERAAAAARPGDTVLLSPAAASFDQFRDFEDRGRAFRAAVQHLREAA